MVDLIKKAFFTGVGALSLTNEMIKEMAQKISKEAKMSESEGHKFVEELLSKTEETRRGFEGAVRQQVEKVMAKLDIPTRKEVQQLRERIAQLEEQKKGNEQ